MSLCRFIRVFIIAIILAHNVCYADDTQPIETFTLKNGMQVVLIPSHRVPAVTHMICYRVGAGDDFPGRSGLAHYNEHMMFQGTHKVPAGEFAQIIKTHGGNMNAFTTSDFTAYHVSIAKELLPLVMQLEADRMLNLAPTVQNFMKEREVIIEERRMSVENKPQALLDEEIQALLFLNHPYHVPVIGWMSEMQALTREDVLTFHHRFYNPANAVLIVAGDMTKQELKPLAEKYYGTLPKGEAYIRHWNEEPPQRGPRHIEMHHKNVKEPELVRYYVAPGVNSGSRELVIPAFVMAQLFGGGTTSVLYQSLVVKQKIATNVGVYYDGITVGPGIFRLNVTPAPGVTLPALEAALDKEISDFMLHGSNEGDLVRAKVLLKADTIYSRDSMENMARTLASLVMANLNPKYFTEWPKRVEQVTEADVRKSALIIFNPDASVTGYLLPEKEVK